MKRIIMHTLMFIALSANTTHAIFDSAKLYLKINAIKGAKTVAEAERLKNDAIKAAADMGLYDDKKRKDINDAYDAATEKIEGKSKNAGAPSTWSQIKAGVSEKFNDRQKK